METNIIICQGSSCFSRGNKENLALIQKYLSEHSLDAEVSFKGQLCTEKCKQSPVIIINGETYSEVTEQKTLEILKAHFNK